MSDSLPFFDFAKSKNSKTSSQHLLRNSHKITASLFFPTYNDCPIGSVHGIFTYISYINHPNVGKDTGPMDPMGVLPFKQKKTFRASQPVATTERSSTENQLLFVHRNLDPVRSKFGVATPWGINLMMSSIYEKIWKHKEKTWGKS